LKQIAKDTLWIHIVCPIQIQRLVLKDIGCGLDTFRIRFRFMGFILYVPYKSSIWF